MEEQSILETTNYQPVKTLRDTAIVAINNSDEMNCCLPGI